MIELGLILAIIGALVAIGGHYAGVPVAARIGFFTFIAGLILIILGYVLPAVDDTRDVDAVLFPAGAVGVHSAP